MSNTTKKPKPNNKKPMAKRWQPYTAQEDELIKKLYATTSTAYIAAQLGRTAHGVATRAVRVLNLRKAGRHRPDEPVMRAAQPPKAEPKAVTHAITDEGRAAMREADKRLLARAHRTETTMAARLVTVRVGKSVITGMPNTVRHILEQRGYEPQEIDKML